MIRAVAGVHPKPGPNSPRYAIQIDHLPVARFSVRRADLFGRILASVWSAGLKLDGDSSYMEIRLMFA